MRRIPAIALAIPLIIILGFLFVLVIPALTNSIIQSAIVETLGRDYALKDCAYIRVDSSVNEVLMGRIRQVYIECPDGDFSGLKAKSLVVFLRGVEFSWKEPLLKKRAKINKINSATAKLVFSEKEINRYISANYSELKGWPLRLQPGKVTARAEVELIGGVVVSFIPRIKGDQLVLEPIDARFDQAHSLGVIPARNWVREVPVNIPVSNLPFDMKVNKILVEKTQLVVAAGN